jgi:DNA-binding beta-propeller fold protein YncE
MRYLKTIGVRNVDVAGRGFMFPYDLAFSSDGRIFVLNRVRLRDPLGTRIQICTLDEEYLGEFGSGKGTGDDQFMVPVAMAFDSQDMLYLTDEALNEVKVFDNTGNFIRRWGSHMDNGEGLAGPSGIAIDREDDVYVVERNNNRVHKLSSDGVSILKWGEAGTGEGQFNKPWGVAVDSQDNVYVADWRNDRIQKFTAVGEFLAAFGESGEGEGQFNHPSSVAVDDDGLIYVADWGNERVQVLDPDGGFVTKLMGEATESKWTRDFLDTNVEEGEARARSALDKDIDFFVDDPHERSSHIEKLFWAPTSVKLDDAGRLYVTDSNRHRLQIYQRTH